MIEAAENPDAFARELAALKQYWATDDDPEVLATETESVLRRHPAVWAKLSGNAPAAVVKSG
jgi:hypothetical protein